jgi:hypothetical protein
VDSPVFTKEGDFMMLKKWPWAIPGVLCLALLTVCSTGSPWTGGTWALAALFLFSTIAPPAVAAWDHDQAEIRERVRQWRLSLSVVPRMPDKVPDPSGIELKPSTSARQEAQAGNGEAEHPRMAAG